MFFLNFCWFFIFYFLFFFPCWKMLKLHLILLHKRLTNWYSNIEEIREVHIWASKNFPHFGQSCPIRAQFPTQLRKRCSNSIQSKPDLWLDCESAAEIPFNLDPISHSTAEALLKFLPIQTKFSAWLQKRC